MSEPPPGHVTRLLGEAAAGSRQASDELLPLLYDSLRQLARARMAREGAGHTLQPTALVHEAYLRLVGGADLGWDNRGHFFGEGGMGEVWIAEQREPRPPPRRAQGDQAGHGHARRWSPASRPSARRWR
jgi:hypothetical protein